MRILVATICISFLNLEASSFIVVTPASSAKVSSLYPLRMVIPNVPPEIPSETSIQQMQIENTQIPKDIRYTDFLKLVKGDQIEKVTFSSDGTQVLGVDVKGNRVRIDYLPHDTTLLDDLTAHEVLT